MTDAAQGNATAGGEATAPLLEVEGLDAWYGAAQILFGLSLTVGRGEAVALLGRNGAGKSTTLKAIMGLVERRARRLAFDGQDVARLPTHALARRGLGYVPEDRRIFTGLTVAENLDVGRQPPRLLADGRPAPGWTTEHLFELFPNLAGMADRRGGQMSGGEQQMLTLARTLMGNPLLVLLDEPSEGVAPIIVEQMAQAILALKQKGLSILLSEQNFRFCEMICDRVYVIEHGELRWRGMTRGLSSLPEVKSNYAIL
ncbi:ABC transporter ATP-binding protein [Bosea sp. 117]|uniref:ABC transporter ATP-binding protein n=1 Tax=Bosea sp. 117 TaxID=1125973 RepID=UPI0004949252|nr:ABC transporter ATP-binding protein [Bosea sp. 117]